MNFKPQFRLVLCLFIAISYCKCDSALLSNDGNANRTIATENKESNLIEAKQYYQSSDARSLNPSNCGYRAMQYEKASDSFKIVGGRPAQLGDWGWQIILRRNGNFICGGSLINSQWIVTAAHCVDGYLNPASYSITIASNFLDSNQQFYTQKRNAIRVIKHENYDSTNMKNDITLIKLSSPVAYSDYVVPICVPKGNVNVAAILSWATGFGTLYSNGPISSKLMEVNMPILSDARCNQKYPETVAWTQICAGDNQNKDTCQGDSGGPLVVQESMGRWFLAGVTSYGYGCGDGGVYTRVSSYYNWMLNKIRAY